MPEDHDAALLAVVFSPIDCRAGTFCHSRDRAAATAMKAKSRALDRIDLKILRCLQENARISYVDLAAQVGLSTTPCLERVKRLERAGVIRGYKAVLDPRALKANLLVFVEISLETQSPACLLYTSPSPRD